MQEDDKAKLVEETGLQLKQINNWFINQRKRNWHSNSQSVTSLKSKRKRDVRCWNHIGNVETFSKLPMYKRCKVLVDPRRIHWGSDSSFDTPPIHKFRRLPSSFFSSSN
ncbi:hypothetical protein GOBAR_AA38985 [Gossypium barbadense]|uniref:Homeobox domain-containing protein n=1 Tax=Gossypium barbadense TaxID=3634 RepID=A0A2P5QID1_GOSBA|nr:hypothetical protein GOBAR_DD28792 [Gossypium barbadense]PPR81726.1 hypothetical protein GOBAR_AA38985 [Gossypium barbadense]